QFLVRDEHEALALAALELEPLLDHAGQHRAAGASALIVERSHARGGHSRVGRTRGPWITGLHGFLLALSTAAWTSRERSGDGTVRPRERAVKPARPRLGG